MANKRCEFDGCDRPAVEDGYCCAAHFKIDVLKLEREIHLICRKEGRERLLRDPQPDNRKPRFKNQSAATSK